MIMSFACDVLSTGIELLISVGLASKWKHDFKVLLPEISDKSSPYYNIIFCIKTGSNTNPGNFDGEGRAGEFINIIFEYGKTTRVWNRFRLTCKYILPNNFRPTCMWRQLS